MFRKEFHLYTQQPIFGVHSLNLITLTNLSERKTFNYLKDKDNLGVILRET